VIQFNVCNGFDGMDSLVVNSLSSRKVLFWQTGSHHLVQIKTSVRVHVADV